MGLDQFQLDVTDRLARLETKMEAVEQAVVAMDSKLDRALTKPNSKLAARLIELLKLALTALLAVIAAKKF